ncbi:hypothetical protein [Photorhabdus bodei]|uniref:Uncharacterized protein n=1 Tax=Photorhabdus bodei TaxID=2029681 RepID=A0ABX0ALZ1_9GAMM|nr:hypothetical protein [Photorhabdus bodei]NDK99853.1 hypothetical protein [Photorhabdus bodei]NDL04045.1 hypothetical protein [Photorhabdus bodei]NDL08034.1 hypothetical protein [Photorhabdus bodei]
MTDLKVIINFKLNYVLSNIGIVKELNIDIYTLWISRWIATARERIPGSIGNYVTGVSECSQQRGNLKDDGYKQIARINTYYMNK